MATFFTIHMVSPLPGLGLLLNGWTRRGARHLVLFALLVACALSPLTAGIESDLVTWGGFFVLWMLLAYVSHVEGAVGYSQLWVNLGVICSASAAPLGTRAHRCPRCDAQADASGWCPPCFAALVPSARAQELATTWAAAFNSQNYRLQSRTMRHPVRHHGHGQAKARRVRPHEARAWFVMLSIAFPDAQERDPRGFQDPDDPEVVWTRVYMHATDHGSGAPFSLLSTNRVRLQDGRVTDLWGATALVSVGSPTSTDAIQMLKFGSVRPATRAVDQPRHRSIGPPTA